MRLTNGQKKGLHAAARQAGLDEAAYRLVLRNLAGVSSSTDARFTRISFITCMAFFEEAAGGTLRGCTPRYWQGEMESARPADGLLWRIRRDAKALGWDEADLDRFLASAKMSSGRHVSLAGAPAVWLVKVLQALKAMCGRQEAAANPGTPDKMPF